MARRRRHGARQADRNQAEQALQPANATIYLRLQYRDPERTVRNFPANFPVRVRFGVDHDPVNPANTRDLETTTLAGGVLRFLAMETLARPWREFTLQFGPLPGGSPPSAQSGRYIFVEAPGQAQHPGFTSDDPNVTQPDTTARFFLTPHRWSLKTSDWALGTQGFGSNGEYQRVNARFRHTQFTGPGNNWPMPIGTEAQPVELVLDPNWHFIRLEFFDRYYGPTVGSGARAGIGRRVSVPPVPLEGFRDDRAAAGPVPDTRSNWTIADSALAGDIVQCLPFINRRSNTGANLPALTGTRLGLRFRFDGDPAWVYSESQNSRQIRRAAPAAASPPLAQAGPERLKWYDLPTIWKSFDYYLRSLAASPPAPGKFFHTATAGDIGAATDRTKPLVFCLDDIVLTGTNLRALAVTSNDRLAVFFHQFANRDMWTSPPGAVWAGPTLSNEGVYTPDANVDPKGYPYSNIRRRDPFGYIFDYPDWTRLVLAQGSLFDVFSERTIDTATDAVGARAAVRWVNATIGANGVAPGNALTPRPARSSPPTPRSLNFFAIQPFYEQNFIVQWHNPQPGPVFQDEWAGAYGTVARQIGRFDLALLRCCDWRGTNEMAVALRYHRLSFDFTTQSMIDNPAPPPAEIAAANPLAGSPPQRMPWAQAFIDNVMARWNGHDAQNAARAWIVLSPPAASPPLVTQVVNLSQYVARARAHHHIRSLVARGGSWVNSGDGDGQVRINAVAQDNGGGVGATDAWGVQLEGRGLAAAHEVGHVGSMPDDYQQGDAIHLNYRSLHVLGSPYSIDERALMRRNWYIRPRCFWHVVEWMRNIPNIGNVNLSVKMGDGQYWIPHYPHFAGSPGRSFLSWPVRFNLRQDAAGNQCDFDAILHFLGEDDYSTQVLPAKFGAGPRVDGILVVFVRIRFTFTSTAGFTTPLRQYITPRVVTALNDALNTNPGRFANFQVATGARQMPCFGHCLLYFVPAIVVDGQPNDAAYRAASVPHLAVSYDAPPPAMPNRQISNVGGGTRKELHINFDAPAFNALAGPARIAQADDDVQWIFRAALECLGLSHQLADANYYGTANAYVPIVRSVMDAAAPAPNVT